MKSNPGNFRSIDEARVSSGLGNSVKITLPSKRYLPKYCLHCACPCESQVPVPVEGDVSGFSSDVKAAGCLMIGFGMGRLIGTLFAMGAARSILEGGKSSKAAMCVPVCQKCRREKGLPRIERVRDGLNLWCCEEYAAKYHAGDYGNSDLY